MTQSFSTSKETVDIALHDSAGSTCIIVSHGCATTGGDLAPDSA